MNDSAKDGLIVALDVETAREARELFARLRDHAGMFKIGSQLFTAAGPGIVRELVSAGARVFLDLKFHDIPNTVAGAGVEAARLGVAIFNVHALGGREMMRRTREAVAEVSEREGLRRPLLIAVTVLTSADSAALEEVGLAAGTEAMVRRLARLTEECGLDGVVASPNEIGLVRGCVRKRDFLIVTPGVRPTGSAADDQKRIMTPAEAFGAGADYLVVGRAILKAPDPQRALIRIVEEMAQARSARNGSGRF
ncbi:MAG TPA: orotidine-5'-phosphate decarboxylase [Pyrinomonadaceae bacterium]|jgi:orotidine-5'-phosphate decarboxylase|nr:orotidine-5'-phosphate decarboxylase [Pyrinomonadaceae bacterium]